MLISWCQHGVCNQPQNYQLYHPFLELENNKKSMQYEHQERERRPVTVLLACMQKRTTIRWLSGLIPRLLPCRKMGRSLGTRLVCSVFPHTLALIMWYNVNYIITAWYVTHQFFIVYCKLANLGLLQEWP